MPEDLAGFNAYFTEEKRHRPAGSFFFAHSPAGSFVVFHRGRRAGRVAFVDRATRAARVVAESMQVFLDALRVAETVGAAPPEHASSKPRLPDAKPGRLQLPRRPQHWEDVDFRRARLPRSAVVRDVHAIRCTFGGASTDARSFTKFERVVLEQPVVATRHLMNVIARHASVHGCASGAKPLSLVNFYFDRVRLTGEFGSWLIRQDSDRLPSDAAAREIASRFYDQVDWAIDIRNARFRELTLRGIPARLVLRDPERHAVILTERLARDGSWRRREPGIVAVLEHALEHPEKCHFLCASDLRPSAALGRKRIADLRAAGFVD